MAGISQGDFEELFVPTTHRKTATLYRMVMPAHICPWGLKARYLLRHHGYAVNDQWLSTREETDTFLAQQGVETTPQVFIDGRRIGGYDDLRHHFGMAVRDPEATSYRPVVAVFAVAVLLALAAAVAVAPFSVLRWVEWSIAFGMCLLALLKLQDVQQFSTMFLNYDLLARRYVPYAYVYPFVELGAGLLMVAGVGLWLAVPAALIVGTVGAASVIKAVYLERRELQCACVGGSSKVPLGFVSLTENLMMVAMALWMGGRALVG